MVLRNCDGQRVAAKIIETLANWNANNQRTRKFHSSLRASFCRIFTGVPLVVDLAAMRSAVKRLGGDPNIIQPLVPVDLVVDHSVQVDFFGWLKVGTQSGHGIQAQPGALSVLKMGAASVQNFPTYSAGIGIVHQVNLEYLAKGCA